MRRRIVKAMSTKKPEPARVLPRERLTKAARVRAPKGNGTGRRRDRRHLEA